MNLNFGTPKYNLFGTDGNLLLIGGPILRHIMVELLMIGCFSNSFFCIFRL